MASSPWDETHVRHEVDHHRRRIANATRLAGTPGPPVPRTIRGPLTEDDLLERLRWARWVAIEAQQLREAALIEARAAGLSWGEIGDIVGCTGEAAREYYGQLTGERA